MVTWASRPCSHQKSRAGRPCHHESPKKTYHLIFLNAQRPNVVWRLLIVAWASPRDFWAGTSHASPYPLEQHKTNSKKFSENLRDHRGLRASFPLLAAQGREDVTKMGKCSHGGHGGHGGIRKLIFGIATTTPSFRVHSQFFESARSGKSMFRPNPASGLPSHLPCFSLLGVPYPTR